MLSSYGALCSDFYINSRLNLRLDLPLRRESSLALFDRVKRERPAMRRFRRYRNELALESDPPEGREESQSAAGEQWLSLRKTSIRAGVVNPEDSDDAYALHRLVFEVCPYFMDISALDVEYVELLYGFDFLAAGNHHEIVLGALLGGSALAGIASSAGKPIECQPLVGFALDREGHLQAHVEVKSRTSLRSIRSGEFREEPISVYLTLRHFSPVEDIKGLPGVLDELRRRGEDLINTQLAPSLLVPLREAIGSGSA